MSETRPDRGTRRRLRLRRWWASPLLAAAWPGLLVTVLLLGLQIVRLPAVDELGKLTFDAYQRAAPRPYQDAPVRVVDIDDETLARLGQWPWPRTELAKLTHTLADAGAAAVVFDIVFSEPDRTSPSRVAAMLRASPDAKGDYADIAALADHDVLMGKALAEIPTVTGHFLTQRANAMRPAVKAGFATTGASPIASLPAFRGAIAPLAVIDQGAAGSGFVSTVAEGDSIVRTAPLLARIGDQVDPSLSLEALRVAQGAGAIVIKSSSASGEMGGGDPGVVAVKVGSFQVPTTRAGELVMYFTAPQAGRTVPAWKVITGVLAPAEMKRLFEGRIVFIGTGAAGLQDLVSTPVSERELGVVVHAEAVEQMILGKFLERPDWGPGLERAILVLLGVVLALALPRLGALRGGALAAAAIAAVIAGSWLAFRNAGFLLDPTYPVLAVAAVYSAGTLFSFYREERARAYIHDAFDRYLSPELVSRIAEDPGQLELGGEEREMTVMFCDIRGFTRISEAMKPQDTIAMLIDLLTPMTDILLARKATIDKYIGDAILAFWNAPLDDPDQHRNAALATLAMSEKMKALNAGRFSAPGGQLELGIGVNTGLCCVGNLGSRQRLNYSLIGDTVNLASRIEGLTRVYDTPIIVGDAMAARIADFALVELDNVRVLGRDRSERLFALLGPPELAKRPDFAAFKTGWAAVLGAYRAQHWDAAEAGLDAVAATAARFDLVPLVQLYAGRIRAFRKIPPAADWDGVYQATEK